MFTGKDMVITAIKPFVYAVDITDIDKEGFTYVDKEGEIKECKYDTLTPEGRIIVTYAIEGKYSKLPKDHCNVYGTSLLRRVREKDTKLKNYWEAVLQCELYDNEVWPKIDLSR